MATPLELRIKRGLDIALPGRPRQALRAAGKIQSVAISGSDFPDIRPEFRIVPGDRVRTGQTVFVDRKRPQIAFTSPVAGIVSAINRGRRRSLDSVVIQLDSDDADNFPTPSASTSPEEIRNLLLKSGLWPSFLERPFGRIPMPDAMAGALFVTAIDTNPLAPDPRVAIGLHPHAFQHGLNMLCALTKGPVFVCQAAGPPLCDKPHDRLRIVMVSGPHPAGLAGTHIHHLAPVSPERRVWQIGYQDVIAMGHLALTGRLLTDRVVAIAGTRVRDPALVRLPLGASLDEALEGELLEGPARVISGPVLSGREAGYLGRYHQQITVLALGSDDDQTGRGWPSIRRLLRGALDAAIIPREAFERVMPLDILPVPMLRALSIGDVETAKELGCLELVEEDLALLSHVCTTGADYGVLLREVLNELAGDR